MIQDEFLVPDYRGSYGKIPPLYSSIPKLRDLYARGDYEGGLVLEPVVGLHRLPVIVLDFASLYPSIMRAQNLCPTTFVGDDKHMRALGLSEAECTRSPAGWWFINQAIRQGVLPLILARYTEARSAAKKEMQKHPEGSPEYARWNALQLQIKVSSNSFYGQMGAASNAAGNMAIAESVTAYGRDAIRKVANYITHKYPDLVILYGDTE